MKGSKMITCSSTSSCCLRTRTPSSATRAIAGCPTTGNERRRVMIGTDIIHNPILLFPDEPGCRAVGSGICRGCVPALRGHEPGCHPTLPTDPVQQASICASSWRTNVDRSTKATEVEAGR